MKRKIEQFTGSRDRSIFYFSANFADGLDVLKPLFSADGVRVLARSLKQIGAKGFSGQGRFKDTVLIAGKGGIEGSYFHLERGRARIREMHLRATVRMPDGDAITRAVDSFFAVFQAL